MKVFWFLFLAAIAAEMAGAQPVDVLRPQDDAAAQALNGRWKFKYIPSSQIGADEGFSARAFDDANWKTIVVPGHWELQGFAEPQYADDVKEGTGLYRRWFKVPAGWKGQRVLLRFEGVLYGLTAAVNGKTVGEWASSFNPVTFDITDCLRAGGEENLLTVRVTTRSKGWNFDNMDCWALSGIYRDVALFAVPELHLADYTARTTLASDGAAEVHVDVTASGAAKASIRLLAPDGNLVKQTEAMLGSDGHGAANLAVSQPQLWTAEAPNLYRLELDLVAGGKTVQHFADRIGLRQVTIDNGVLKLNGTPIKLHGIDHHDLWPEGRIATEENMRRDLRLMHEANINFIRTSHYPPHPRFIELCDEMGIYVDEEVPYIHGRKWLEDPAYQDVLLTRARATVMRDKNRPSVIFWSVGNENPITELGNNTGQRVKELDPTRPITFPTMGSYFVKEWRRFPDFMDIYAPHYPGVRQARAYADELPRPIVFTEYAHERGLARAGAAVQDLWELFYHTPRIAGGAIWMFQDQGIFRTAADISQVPDGDLMVWLDEHHYYDTHGFYAMDGIVYSDRTPQVDYWQVRKVYSSVQIKEQALAIVPGPQKLSVSVENRYDFRSLAGMKVHWTVRRNGAAIGNGTAALAAKPKETEILTLDATLPRDLSADVFTLELNCVDEKNVPVYERSIRLDSGLKDGARWSAVEATLPAARPALEISTAAIAVRRPGFQLTLDRKSGQLELLDSAGNVLVSAFGPHVGRHPTINDLGKNREHEPVLWRGNLLREVSGLTTDAREVDDGVELTVSGDYVRPGKPDEGISGQFRFFVPRSGAIQVSYDYTPKNATGEMLEAGFALAVPAAQSELRWLGQGPYAAYPGKDRLDEYGSFHLNRDDLYFPGNRRGVELALLTNPAGAGFLVASSRAVIDLENTDNTTIFSCLALVPGDAGNGSNEGEKVDFSSRLKAPAIKRIAGNFTLLPLGARWPEPVSRWFGAPGARVAVKKPFLRSYDQ